MNMTVYDFMDLFTDKEMQKIELFDCESGTTVFEGLYADIPSKYDDEEVNSIDNIYQGSDKLTINISVESED